MYSTCVFCNQSLGANEALESFPVGRRVAFDAAKGRLWVVCRKCERWNLSPIEERWEAIEDCERLFRSTRARVSTEHVGLARVADGLDLVRVGRPMRPEFAAWRYGDQFGRRRRRTILYTAGAAAAFSVIVVGGAVTGAISAGVLSQAGNWVNIWVNGRTVLKLRTDDGRLIKLKNPDIRRARILPGSEPGNLAITVGRGRRAETFQGPEAERVASQIVPKLNAMGGRQSTVRDAVGQIEAMGGPDAFLASAYDRLQRDPALTTRRGRRHGSLARLPSATRLAVEMALHEERERRALEGELEILEDAWREAEEIAGIADDLVLPPGTDDFIREQRSRLPER